MTYIPPVNGGRINATISGNTAGAGSLVSTGTMTLAGGNNITLSQNGNAVTISGGAGGGNFSAGMSTIGNTSGNTGLASNQIVFVGGNNITLSQSTAAGGNTLTVSAANQTVQTQNLFNLTLSGNTAGAMAQVSSGTLTLAGGNNITLSQNGNAVTVSAANQTVQTQNLHNVTLSGNTAGVMAHVSSGTLTLAGGNNITLSQNGNAVTISGGAGGAGGIALANSQTTFSSGTVNVIEGGGAITIASTTGQSFQVSVPATSSLSATGAVSISTNASTISIGAPQNGTVSAWEPQPLGYMTLSNTQLGNASLFFYKLQPQAYVSASQLHQLASMTVTSSTNTSHAGTISLSAGIYTVSGSSLSLITQSTGSTAYQWTNTSNNSTASLIGLKALTLPLNINMSPGNYWIGLWSRTSIAGSSYAISNMVFTGNSGVFSGLLGAAVNATQGIQEGVGVYTSSVSTAMPTAVPMASIIQSNLRTNAVPYMDFKNMTF